MLRFVADFMLLSLSTGPLMSSLASNFSQSFHMENLNFVKVPTNILGNHPGITSLFLQYNKIQVIRKADFPANASQHLVYINLRGNNIKYIEEDAFSNMPNLHVVDLNQNSLHDVPKLKAPKIRELLLRDNKIRRISYNAMRHYQNLEHLDLKHNEIVRINGGSFKDNQKLVFMVLSDNPLREVQERGLVGPTELQFLYLENTELTKLPSQGISSLTTLNIKGSKNLISLPDPSKFEKLSEIFVEYRMHCCAFRAVRDFPKLNNSRLCPDKKSHFKRRKRDLGNETGISGITDFDSLEDSSDIDLLFKNIIDSFHADDENVTDPCEMLINLGPEPLDNHMFIKCSPEPDEFNPCEDVMGTHVLRVFSWVISIFAVIGNMFQLVILFSSRQEVTVYKLLMYNLGLSNLLMGIYILVLCCVDGYTYGKYYNYAQSWQYNGGCKILGFIALFATQLSVCSLILITVERFLLIIFALQVTNQMKILHAVIGITFSWIYSFIVSLLPLSDVIGSYTKVAICLPMDMQTSVSEGYVVWLLLTYVIAFLLIVFCYIRMYINISEVRPGNSSQTIDIQVAKRMSMIIFSNFMCWLPISIAGLMALYSNIEFNVGVGKFLLVFIFPLNACTNPFLYAIFTKVFRGDTLALLNSCGLFKVADANHIKRNTRRNNPHNQTALNHLVSMQETATSCATPNKDHEINIARSPIMMDVPETTTKVLINRTYGNGTARESNKLNDISMCPLKNTNRRACESFRKLRSCSKRGLLESEIKQQYRDPRFRSESNDTCSTGISNMENDEDFSMIIGSIQKAECSMLLE